MDDIDKSSHSVISSDGNLNCGTDESQFLSDGLDCHPGIGSHAIKLIDKDDSRNAVPDHLFVDSDSLWLYSAHTAHKQHGTIQHSEGPFHFDGKINVARSIDEIDMMIFPHQMSGSWLNGNTFFFLQLHEVHRCPDTIWTFYFMDRANLSCVE